ncbi:LOW QUALITY PROTEIN: hypothetical protein MAR_002239 [Mya arenaria]|uniref:Uncharacterized protein n=1 Tax=Mya arenaria TaxID=6604 RepID=A0ABY7FHJ6_MYAAR|nr:LOW QUALITY PROTEIN: hypothetical protein MAR_002239 [Mya arenaria]
MYINDIEASGLPDVFKAFQFIHYVTDKTTERIDPGDLIRVSMDNPELDFPNVLLFMRRSALTEDPLLLEKERVLQSYKKNSR